MTASATLKYPLTIDRILPYLRQRCEDNWLAPFESRQFYRRVGQLAASFQQFPSPPVILLSEADPFLFLSTFIAAVTRGCPIFLADPAWQEREWKQVFEGVKPDLILGCNAPHLAPTFSVSFPVQKAIYIPTGGTSGQVRFATHTWETLSASVMGLYHYLDKKSINSFCILPLHHVSGLMQFLRSFLTGGCFYCCSYAQFKTLDLTSLDLEAYFISLVPTQLRFLLQSRAEDLARFETVFLGGAPAGKELLKRARDQKIRLALAYGMTETAAQIATLKPEEFLQGGGSNGRLLPHVRAEIVEGNRGNFEGAIAGRIGVRSDSLFLGYYPELLSRDRLYLTDDLGYFDEGGYLHLIGRNSQKIITGGENVFPQEVEAEILATQLALDVCVIGIPHAVWGEAVTAVFVPRSPGVGGAKIERAIAGKMSKFKQPKYWLAVESLPRNDRGKIKRDRVLEIAREQLGPLGG